MTDNTKSASELSRRNSEIAFGYNFNESRMKKCLRIMDSIAPGKFLDLGATQEGDAKNGQGRMGSIWY